MDKIETLEAIEIVKKYHLSQMEKITLAIDGEKVDDPTEVSKMKCSFGKWLYLKENHLEKYLGALFYNNLEMIHSQWHQEYTVIHAIIFKDEKKGLFSKLIGSSKIDGMELDKAKLYFSELQTTTSELLKILASCERKVSAMSEARFL